VIPSRRAPTRSDSERRRWSDEHQRLQRAYATYAAPLAADLEHAGFAVDRLRDLRRRGVGGPAALPVLLKWLPRVTFAALKVDLIYALGSPWARPAACQPLLAEHTFLRPVAGEAASRVRAAICTSLERIADESVFDEMVGIAQDRTLGAERAMAVVALGNMRQASEMAARLLRDLLDDDSVELFALLALSKLGARQAIRDVAIRTRHRNPRIRQLAVRTVAAWTSRAGAPLPGSTRLSPSEAAPE
jgi:hypothetical protein